MRVGARRFSSGTVLSWAGLLGIAALSIFAVWQGIAYLLKPQALAQGVYNAGAQQQVQGQDSYLIILDASESMLERLPDGQTRMAAAKRTILETLQKIPQQQPVGLRVYGTDTFNACRSTKLLVPISPNNRYQIASQMTKIQPTGMTPITFSLTTAVRDDFNHLNGRRNIILISDGMETCGADPCDLAVSMVQNGVDVKINVIGYGLKDLEGIRQLKCAALATKGRFYNTHTAAELSNGLDQLLGARKDVQAKIYIPQQQQQLPPQGR